MTCRLQHLFMSCRQHPLMSSHTFTPTSYFHVDLILSCRPHTFMSTSYLYVDLNISSCRHRLPSLTVDIDFHLLLSTSCHLCVHLFHVEHIKYIINSGQVYHDRCRLSISSIPAKYIIIDVDQVCHRCRPSMSSMSTLYIMPRQRSTAQYEGILPVTSTFRSWSVRLSTRIVSCMSFLLS